LLGWTRERLRVELGEFDAACLDSEGSPEVLMEAKARVVGPDGLASLLRKWLVLREAGSVVPGDNAANKYLELLRVHRRAFGGRGAPSGGRSAVVGHGSP